MKEMNKKDYISPSMSWVWVGMSKEIADMGVPAVAGSQTGGGYAVKEQNVWDEDASSSSTPSQKNLWDEQW